MIGITLIFTIIKLTFRSVRRKKKPLRFQHSDVSKLRHPLFSEVSKEGILIVLTAHTMQRVLHAIFQILYIQ